MAHKFECFQSGCSFMVRADTRDEIRRLVKIHAEEEHDLSLEDEAIEEQIEPA